MADEEVTIEDAEIADEDYAEELPELVEVRINDPFSLGVRFALGVSMVLILYGLIGLFVLKVILIELFMH